MLSLSQVVGTPTHTSPNGDSSLIDLALVSNTTLLHHCSTIPPIVNSDHNGLHLSFKWRLSGTQVQQHPRTIWRYRNADFRMACHMIDETDWDSLLPEEDIDVAASNWHRKFMDIISTCIPQQTVKSRKNVPWLTKNIIRHMRKRNAAFHATKRSNKPEVAAKYKRLRNTVVKMLREAKNSHLNRLNVGSKKQFWKAVKVLSKQQSTIPTLHYQEATAETNYEKAAMLNEYFSSCFNTSVPPLSQLDEERQTHTEFESASSEDLLCTTEEILSYIQALDATKASGPDGISIKMLKYTATSIAPSIAKLFNISIKLGHFPTCWKTSSVVPIPKSSQHNEAANYRPISLLSVVSKLLERHIHQVITIHLNENRPLSNMQLGFQSGKSTVTALLAVTHDWFKALESRHNVCSVFFDLRKAFDSVPHRLLLEKLNTYALDSHILSWLHSYLAERKQHVVVGGASSPDSPVLSGVPQGSVLGPLLFLIYIDDVSSLQLSENSVLNLYADDMLLYKQIKCSEDYQQLQMDIDKISSWVDHNNLSLNPAKCKTMLLSRKRNLSHPPQLLLNEAPLEQVEAFKYLGVLISSDLSWSRHIDSICAKGKRLIGLLYRRFSTNVSSERLLEMYKYLVRPHLEYAAPVWDPHLLKDIKSVENVQKYGLKMCLKRWDLGYQELLHLAQIPTLENRRIYLKLCTLFKIIHGLFPFTPDVFTPQPSRHNYNLPFLYQPFAHTNAFQASFVPSTVSIWNHLPPDALTAPSPHTFKLNIAPLFL